LVEGKIVPAVPLPHEAK